MQYDDLLTVPYKTNGRDNKGMDCYGLVLECCRRSGKDLHDAVYASDKVGLDKIVEYVSSLNVIETGIQKTGTIVQCEYDGRLHMAFMIDEKVCIHMTYDGVRLTPATVMRNKRYFEVKA